MVGESASGVNRGAPALVLIEIANFAALRRTIGVARADVLAQCVAEPVAALLPDAAVVPLGRHMVEVRLTIGGAADLDETLGRLRWTIERPMLVGDFTCQLQFRIGSALGTDAATDQLMLIEQAEEALAQAQPNGSIQSPEPVKSPLDVRDAAIGRALDRAIGKDDLFLHYQPKLHLRRQEITSVEALIRWRHPRLGLIVPNDFVPAAERCGAIKAMTLWTLRRVIADQRTMADQGHALPVFVNIAGVLLSDAGFVDDAVALVRDSGATLGFEITETSVIRDPGAAIAHLQRLADIGVTITIDDYGAGLSSLAYLKQLPARELKIDKLFVTQLASSHRDPLIVRSTIDLAHAMEMEVVAEGVETPTSLALLSVMGCDMVQGFLISRPLMLDGLLTFLREERHRDVLDQTRSPLQRLAAVRARS